MLKQFSAWLIVVLAAVGIAGGLGFYKYKEFEAAMAAASAFPEPSEAVVAIRARQGEWSATAKVIGTVVALRQLELRNEVTGTIAELGFKSGETVKAGQLLVQLDVRQEKASLAAAEAETRLAKLTLDRRQGLRNSPAFSEQELDKAREEYAAATARTRNLEVAIDKKRIAAPFDARIGITDLQPGAYLDAGTRIATLQGVDKDVYIDFALPQDSAATIRKGATVTISSAALPGGEAPVKIIAESESVDRTNRMVQFRAVAAGFGDALRPGMFVDVMAVVSAPQPAVLVPLTALRRSPYGEHVFLLAEEGGKLRARQRTVQTGIVQGDDVVIRDGLKPGDLIAAAGAFKLRDGLLVQAEIPPVANANLPVN
ncbi:MAG: efflux RND transporter periplasmic adaptor subunit [Rhodomicrobium sp.]|nr:efflux RND transporter periplasmic adaptor subunit [Rhodomicrobium sp.]